MDRVQEIKELSFANKKERAAGLFESAADSLLSSGKLDLIIELSEPLKAHLSLSARLVRWRAFRELGESRRALEEIQFFRGQGILTPDESAAAMNVEAGCLWSIGEHKKCAELFKQCLSVEGLSLEARCRAYAQYFRVARVAGESEREMSLHLQEFEIIALTLSQSSFQRTQFLWARAVRSMETMQYEFAISDLELVVERLQLEGLRPDMHQARFDLLSCYLSAGRFEVLREKIPLWTKEYEDSGFGRLDSYLHAIVSMFYLYEGKRSLSLKQLFTALENRGSRPIGRSDDHLFTVLLHYISEENCPIEIKTYLKNHELEFQRQDWGGRERMFIDFPRSIELLEGSGVDSFWIWIKECADRLGLDCRLEFYVLAIRVLYNKRCERPSSFNVDELIRLCSLSESPLLKTELLILVSYVEFVSGNFGKALECVDLARKRFASREVQVLAYRMECVEALSLFAIGKTDFLNSKARQLRVRSSLTEGSWDIHIPYFLELSLEAAKNRGRLKACQNESHDSERSVIQSVFLDEDLSSDTTQSPRIFEFWWQLKFLCGAGQKYFLRVETPAFSEVVSERALSPILRKRHDLILDERDLSLKIRNTRVDMKRRPTLFRFLAYLLVSDCHWRSKEDLAVFVWLEDYSPLVHDGRIYVTVNTLRKLLEKVGLKDVIVERDGLYSVSEVLRFCSIRLSSILNERQAWIMDYLEKEASIEKSVAQRLLRVSGPLIKRDFDQLIDRGLVKRRGEGKDILFSKVNFHPSRSIHFPTATYSVSASKA